MLLLPPLLHALLTATRPPLLTHGYVVH